MLSPGSAQLGRRPTLLWFLCVLLGSSHAQAREYDPKQLLIPEGEAVERWPDPATPKPGKIRGVAFSHDGTLLATSSESAVCVWDLSAGRLRSCFAKRDGAPANTAAVAFSTQDLWVAAGTVDGSVDLWSMAGAGRESGCRFPPLPDDLTIGRRIRALRFVPESGDLLSLGAQERTGRSCKGTFESYTRPDMPARQKPQSLPELIDLTKGLIEFAEYDGSGRTLAVATRSAVGVWSTTGQKRWIKPDTASLVVSLALSSDGNRLATGHLNGGISTWDVASEKETRLSVQAGMPVRALSLSPKGDRLVAGTEDGVLSLWDPRSGASLREFRAREPAEISALAFHPIGGVVASASGGHTVTLWDAQTGEKLRTLRFGADRISDFAFSPKGKYLATAAEDGSVRVFSKGREGEPAWYFNCDTKDLFAGKSPRVAFSPTDEQFLAVAAARTIQILNPETCIETDPRIKDPASELLGLAFSRDGRRLAAGAKNGAVLIWDFEERKLAQTLLGHRDEVAALSFGPESSGGLATGSFDKTVRLWEVAAAKEIQKIEAQGSAVRAVVISQDGKRLAIAAGNELTLYLFNAVSQTWEPEKESAAGAQPGPKKRTHAKAITGLDFHPDGRYLASSSLDGTVRLFDMEGAPAPATLSTPGEPTETSAVRFSPDGSRLTAASPGRLTFWAAPDWRWSGELRQNGENWASFTQESGRLYRKDDGQLLWARGPEGSMVPAPRPLSTSPAQLHVKADFKAESGRAPSAGTIIVTITNAPGSGSAYWLRVELSDLSGSTDLRDRLTWMPPAVHQRLDGGERVTLEIPVALREFPGAPPWLMSVCVKAGTSYATPPGACGEGGREVTVGLGFFGANRLLLITIGILICAGVLALIISLLIGRRRILSHPVVAGTLAEQDTLGHLSLRSLPEANQVLVRAEKYGPIKGLRRRAVSLSGATIGSWERALSALDSPAECARRLAESWSAVLEEGPVFQTPELAMYRIGLPSLALNVPTDMVLLICSSSATDAPTVVAQCTQLGEPLFALLVDLTLNLTDPAEARSVLAEKHEKTNFVSLTEASLKSILLATTPKLARQALVEAIVRQCPLDQLVPYQESNEIKADREGFFFGRRAELDRLLANYRQNFFLMGPRAMGKSSLLNAFKRELERRHPNRVLVSKIQLFSSDPMANLDTARIDQESTPEDFYRWILKQGSDNPGKHLVFLLDEVDKFIERERDSGYKFSAVMRALSGEGRASFVLTGNQRLYEATRTPEHPLRNFGELLQLEPLDRDSARAMILEPLAAFGLRFAEPEATVDWLLDQTGRRPQLLSRSCMAIVRLKPPYSGEAIAHAEMKEGVLAYSLLWVEIDPWGTGMVDLADRIVMRATLLMQRPTPGELAQFLSDRGLRLSPAELDASLSNLYALYYLLVEDEQGRLYCPVGLFRDWISSPAVSFPEARQWRSSDERLKEELDRDLAEFRTGRSVSA